LEEAEIRIRVRALILTGQLPCEEPDHLWAGRGDGKLCIACREPIDATEVESEVDLQTGATVRLHRACHVIWEEECEEPPVSI
jgi:hypothetical protein